MSIMTAAEALGPFRKSAKAGSFGNEFDHEPHTIAPDKTIGQSWLAHCDKYRNALDKIESEENGGDVSLLIASVKMLRDEMECRLDVNGRFMVTPEDVDAAVRAEPRRNSERPRIEIRDEITSDMDQARKELVALLIRAESVKEAQASFSKRKARLEEVRKHLLTPEAMAAELELVDLYRQRSTYEALGSGYDIDPRERSAREVLVMKILRAEAALEPRYNDNNT
jgi:hypothetical protein